VSALFQRQLLHNICSPDNINRNLSWDVPSSNKLVDLLRSALSSLLDARVTRRVKALETLLLDSLL
jgi:hypothetical protein